MLLIICAIISYNNKNLDKYVFNSRDLKNSSLFAIMLEDKNGEYKQSTEADFPGYEYFYNQTKSGCMNSSGKNIPDSLLYDQENKKATVRLNSSGRCYLYFNRYKTDNFASKLIDSGDLWDSGLEGDGYRFTGTGITCSYDDGKYVIAADNQQTTPSCPKRYNYTRTTISDGTTTDYTYQTSCPSDTTTYTYSCNELNGETSSKNIPSNFVCFGTTDKTECTTNKDKYMYRIIGVFSDINGNNHVKLIKYKQLGKYAWNADYQTDISWENSDMYKGLNGSYFLTNTTYDYLQDTLWLNRIENWTWSAANSKTREDQTNNPNYYYSTAKGIYLNEMHKTSSENLCKNQGQTAINCNGGEWTNPAAKIGLMYASDYALSLGSRSLELTTGVNSNLALLKTGWMHQSNNDNSASTVDWTITRIGMFNNYNYNYAINGSGAVGAPNPNFMRVQRTLGVRPVFYLTSDVSSNEGFGTIDNPYILGTSSSSSTLKVDVKNAKNIMTATITKGTGNLTKYCINNKATINDCEWKNITSATITYTMSEYKKYYVHVIDDQGFIAHVYLNYEAKLLSQKLIDTKEMWQSGLEDDGYRYVGRGVLCSYDNGGYLGFAVNQYTTPSCPTRYNFSVSSSSSGTSTDYYYKTYCPSGTTCTSFSGTLVNDTQIPNNYICFGTTDLSTCLNNQDKYMYRIIGTFKGTDGNYHTKLIFNSLIDQISYNDIGSCSNWGSSSLYNDSNDSLFINSTYYSYLQEKKWLDKIEDWTWSAVNLHPDGASGLNFQVMTSSQVYLYEMNKDDKQSTIGSWTTPTGKIGALYVSDYLLSVGSDGISRVNNYEPLVFKTNWLSNYLVKDQSSIQNENEWFMSLYGTVLRNNVNVGTYAYIMYDENELNILPVNYSYVSYRPVFYLTSDVKSIPEGDGTSTNPYMIVE